MSILRSALLACLVCLGLCTALPVRAQLAINLDGTYTWTSGERLRLRNVGVVGQGSYNADFLWDAASSGFRLDPASVESANDGSAPMCPSMRFIASVASASGTARVYLGADFMIDTWSNTIQVWLTAQASEDGSTATGFPFRPARLRLVQNGHVYALDDIADTAAPHFVPDNNWLPNLEPIQPGNRVYARIVDFPVGFDVTRSFYVFYGSGTPSAPATDDNDAYYYCTYN
jgi:hypothetical protein